MTEVMPEVEEAATISASETICQKCGSLVLARDNTFNESAKDQTVRSTNIIVVSGSTETLPQRKDEEKRNGYTILMPGPGGIR